MASTFLPEDIKQEGARQKKKKLPKWMRLAPKDVKQTEQKHRVIASMKTTAISRYNASKRLSRQTKVTFWVSISFSLGLIFIPLMQLAKVPLKFNGDVLSAIQIFLAVAILVFSIVIGTARYELRAHQLDNCGNNIKNLIRELRAAQISDGVDGSEELKKFHIKYNNIISNVENHERQDYILAILRSPDLFKLGLLARVHHWIKFLFFSLISHLPSIILVLVEILFITEMFGVTKIFE